MDSHEERRQISRADYTVTGQARYNGRVYQGEIVNISLNGLLFRSDERMDVPEGEKITVMIHLNAAEETKASAIHCVVVRKKIIYWGFSSTLSIMTR